MWTIEVGAETLVRFAPDARFSAVDQVDGDFADGVRVHCQPGAPPRRLADCLACHRFRGASTALEGITLRCEWNDRDPVSDRMTRAPALVTVASCLEAASAAELARARGVHHLPVVDDGKLVGIACEGDLGKAQPGETVAQRMRTEVFAIRPMATLGEAATAMQALGIDCLVIVSDGLILGIITGDDLRRSGASL
jgi:CBS domain-containing protein